MNQKQTTTTPDSPNIASFRRSAQQNLLPYSEYAYGMFHACRTAKRLEIPAVSVIEFGVAGGNGLVAMEQHSQMIEELLGVQIQVYGFDTGQGLTPPADYRDLPYTFREGNYKMDIPALEARLTRAKLLLGKVAQTARDFLKTYAPAPIAFVSFDMDYYSSTMDAFQIFGEDAPDHHFLPRIFMHFDDVVGDEISLHNEFVGELLAIRDFNASHQMIKIAENRSFRSSRANLAWHHQSYVMHRFSHPLYGTYISRHGAQTASLGTS